MVPVQKKYASKARQLHQMLLPKRRRRRRKRKQQQRHPIEISPLHPERSRRSQRKKVQTLAADPKAEAIQKAPEGAEGQRRVQSAPGQGESSFH